MFQGYPDPATSHRHRRCGPMQNSPVRGPHQLFSATKKTVQRSTGRTGFINGDNKTNVVSRGESGLSNCSTHLFHFISLLPDLRIRIVSSHNPRVVIRQGRRNCHDLLLLHEIVVGRQNRLLHEHGVREHGAARGFGRLGYGERPHVGPFEHLELLVLVDFGLELGPIVGYVRVHFAIVLMMPD